MKTTLQCVPVMNVQQRCVPMTLCRKPYEIYIREAAMDANLLHFFLPKDIFVAFVAET